jgi:hypothetical protein
MADIFISHVEEDAQEALNLALGLEESGYSTWIYEVDSIPGRSFLLQTSEEIDKANVILFIISSESLNSRQIESEIVHAHDAGKEFIPLLKNIEFNKFQHRRPDYAQVIGARISVSIPDDGIHSLLPRIIEGLITMGIQGKSKPNDYRLTQIRRVLNQIQRKQEKNVQKPVITEKLGEQEAGISVTSKVKLSPKRNHARAWLIVIPIVIVFVVALAIILPKFFKTSGPIIASSPIIQTTNSVISHTTIVSTTPALQEMPNPVAYWKFDEVNGTIASDSSGNGYNGVLKGNITRVEGKSGNALSLVAENDYVDIGTNDIFNFDGGSGDFTIDAWIKPTVMPSFVSAIVAKATESPFSGWSFYIYGNNDGTHPANSLGFGGNGVWEITSAANIITPGEWTHIAVTKSGKMYTLYKDGAAVASTQYGNLQTSTASLKIGRNYPDGSPDLFGFTGLIDEVHIWNKALTLTQIFSTSTSN